MGLSERFSHALEKLLGSFTSYARVQRSPDNVAEVGRRRVDLEDARASMKAARQQEGLGQTTRREPSEWIAPGLGRSATRLEKSAAFVAIGLFLVILFGGAALGVYAYRSTNPIDVVELSGDRVEESLLATENGSCRWTLSFALQTEEALGVQVRDVGIGAAPPGATERLLVRSRTNPAARFARVSYKFDECPASPDDIEHGALQVTYTIAGSAEELTKSFNF